MNLLNPGVEKIIFYDDSNVYTLSGNDISTSSSLTKRQQTRTGSRGGHLFFLTEHSLELKFSDASIYESLSGDRFSFVVEKNNGFYVWGVNSQIIKEEDIFFDPESEDYPFTLNLTHISNTDNIGQNGNLLGEFYDFDGDGVAYGWSINSGDDPRSFLSGVQYAEDNAQKTLGFAFPGQTKTFSVNFNKIHANGNTLIRLQYIQSGSPDVSLGTQTETVTTTGVHTVTFQAPANSDKLAVRVFVDSITSADSIQFSDAKLQID